MSSRAFLPLWGKRTTGGKPTRDRCAGADRRQTRTHNGTQNVALAGVLVAHAQVGEHGGLVLGDGGVVDAADLGELVGVDELEGRAADELARLEA